MRRHTCVVPGHLISIRYHPFSESHDTSDHSLDVDINGCGAAVLGGLIMNSGILNVTVGDCFTDFSHLKNDRVRGRRLVWGLDIRRTDSSPSSFLCLG